MGSPSEKTAKKKKKPNPLQWVLEPLMDIPSYFEKPMFGCLAAYVHGRLSLVLASGEDPWNGILIPTGHEHHDSIRRDFPHTVQHPVLKKWIYLPEASEEFESTSSGVVEAVLRNDRRFGVEPQEKKKRTKKDPPRRKT
ncbi:MAG: hypothetical protein OHK006_08240 [Thermodesulfovibrionales bacterium]